MKDGNFISKSGCTGSGNGQFNRPKDIAVNAENGITYVADTKNYRIQAFDMNGTFISKGGTKGNSSGQFLEPTGVTLDPLKQVVYVGTKK